MDDKIRHVGGDQVTREEAPHWPESAGDKRGRSTGGPPALKTTFMDRRPDGPHMTPDTSGIPYEAIPGAIVDVLGRRGSTIAGLGIDTARHPGDPTQRGRAKEEVWHRKRDVDAEVARMLKLHPDIWGPDRKTSDFGNATAQAISSLRRRGHIEDWSRGGRLGIIRLASVPRIRRTPRMDTKERRAPEPLPRSEEEMRRTFVSILSKGSKNNTYKFALARAILEHCGRHDAGTEITYEYFAEKFVEYYWHQACKFRIKQDFYPNRDPVAVRAVKDVFGGSPPGRFDMLDGGAVRDARDRILRGVFGHARNKTSLVVPKFQKLMEGGRAVERRAFYDWDDDEKIVRLRPAALEFLRGNRRILSMAVLAEWAKYLERVNGSLPRLVAKIEQEERGRGSLAVVRRELLGHARHCFYCGSRLEDGLIHVDHLIPWSYIFDDGAWNLVLACRDCNLRKSGSLPQDEFRGLLVDRNARHGGAGMLRASLDLLDAGKGWAPEIRNHYRNCREYGFTVRRMP